MAPNNDYSELLAPENKDFFNFAFIEYDRKEGGRILGKLIGERIFFRDYKSAQEYFKTIDFIDCFCFRYKKTVNMDVVIYRQKLEKNINFRLWGQLLSFSSFALS